MYQYDLVWIGLTRANHSIKYNLSHVSVFTVRKSKPGWKIENIAMYSPIHLIGIPGNNTRLICTVLKSFFDVSYIIIIFVTCYYYLLLDFTCGTHTKLFKDAATGGSTATEMLSNTDIYDLRPITYAFYSHFFVSSCMVNPTRKSLYHKRFWMNSSNIKHKPSKFDTI